MKLDFRKKQQYIGRIYVWLYPKKNLLAYGINGTSKHFAINNYKELSKTDILNKILNDCGGSEDE